ncbi:MAG TPA: hypothetical protein VHZ26_08595 [Caulobacteraceae bacterium]|nr:hypothetical protein [Caulobacteraceae bacterium]
MADHLHRRSIARLSTEYLACILCEAVAETGLDILDFAIVMVVSTSNVGHLKGTAEALAHDHGSDAAVPPELMAPVTLQGIAESLKLPSDLARERVEALAARGVLVARADGFIIGTPVTSSGTAARLADKNIAMARRFVRQIAEAGIG